MSDQKWIVFLRENIEGQYSKSIDVINAALSSSGLQISDNFTNYGNSCPLYAGCIIVAKTKDEEQFVGFFKEKNVQGDFVLISLNSKKKIGLVVVRKEEIIAVRYPILPTDVK